MAAIDVTVGDARNLSHADGRFVIWEVFEARFRLSTPVRLDSEPGGDSIGMTNVTKADINLSGCHVEMAGRNRPDRTPDMRERPAALREVTAAGIFDIEDSVRVRIAQVDEDLLSAVNFREPPQVVTDHKDA